MIIGIIVGLVLLGVVLVAVDWRQARLVLGRADWAVVPVALLFTAFSYMCLSYGFVAVNRIFGISIGQRDLFEIGFVSMTLSHLMSAAGYPLRILLMQRRGLAVGDSLAATLVHSYLNNLALFALLPFGLIYLLVSHPLSRGQVIAVGLVAGLLALVFVITAAVFFVGTVRTIVLRVLQGGMRRLAHRDIGPTLQDFEATLTRGTAVLQRRPLAVALPLGLIVADWSFTVVALGFCFRALGTAVSPGVLVTGFASPWASPPAWCLWSLEAWGCRTAPCPASMRCWGCRWSRRCWPRCCSAPCTT